MNGVLKYLSHLLLDDQVVQCGDWSILTTGGAADGPTTMVMDSTVLSHLEILRDSEGSERGSV